MFDKLMDHFKEQIVKACESNTCTMEEGKEAWDAVCSLKTESTLGEALIRMMRNQNFYRKALSFDSILEGFTAWGEGELR